MNINNNNNNNNVNTTNYLAKYVYTLEDLKWDNFKLYSKKINKVCLFQSV